MSLKFPKTHGTPDCPTITISSPRDQIDLDKILPGQVKGYGCGTYFHVQFLNHEETELLASALYVVTENKEALSVNEANPYQPITNFTSTCKVKQIGDWWYSSTEGLNAIKGETLKVVADGAKIVWNPGKKVHQLKLGDEVIYENADKDEVKKVAEAA